MRIANDGLSAPARLSVILPCRGVDGELSDCLEALASQDVSDYELLLVTTGDDASLGLLRACAARHPDRVRVVIAPATPPTRAQKLTNQLAAVEAASPGGLALVFVDSDIRPGPGFLRSLVAPLADARVGVATGFRWYVPSDGRASSYVRSAWNAAGLAFMFDETVRYAWGGAMAIRREDFDSLGVAGRWARALSDDHTLTAAVREVGLRVHFVPECLMPSSGNCNWRELLEWTTRQTKISRVYAPRFFWKTVRSHVIGLAVLAAVAVVGALTGWWAAAAGALALTVLLQLAGFAATLKRARTLLAGEAGRHLSIHAWRYLAAAPAALTLYGLNVARALVSRRIAWRGIAYLMAGPADTRVVPECRRTAGCAMRSRRPLSINNSLVHGICNYNCRTCGVNKAAYRGPREFQPREVTARLIRRVEEAARAGIRVRYLANSGDGEPTLHPEFAGRMAMFGRMLDEWNAPGVGAPEVGVVTNGLRLLEPGVLEAVADNGLTLLVSFPTPDPESYGRLVMGRPGLGAALLARVLPGIERAMVMRAAGRLRALHFHVSPPDREIVRRDFPSTVECLSRMAGRAGLVAISLIIFPATSNRSGLVRNEVRGVDFCRDLFERFDGRTVNGVSVRLTASFRRFFPRIGEVADLVRSFSLPCMWNAHLFVTASGDSICCNDQAVREPMGNVLTGSIAELMRAKELRLPGGTCVACDQRPERMTGSPAVRLFALAAGARLALARVCDGKAASAPARKEVDDVVLAEESRTVPDGGAARGALPDALPGTRNRLLNFEAGADRALAAVSPREAER